MEAEQRKDWEVIYDMGSGLLIVKISLDKIKEQDINARIMKTDMQDRLTANIKGRKQLESLPLLVLIDGKVEIISGHHRVKSARAAGLEEIIAILDVSGLTRSQIAAKQLAHNAIAGFDDESALREICKLITDIDDMMESAMPEGYFKDMEVEINKLATPSVEFDFKNVMFTFLPHQFNDFENLVKRTASADLVGVADREQFEGFVETLGKVQKFQDVKSVGTAVNLMVKSALKELGENGFDDSVLEWVPIASVIGGASIPAEAAEVMKAAVKKAEKEGTVTSKNRWQLIEYLCADYLGGS